MWELGIRYKLVSERGEILTGKILEQNETHIKLLDIKGTVRIIRKDLVTESRELGGKENEEKHKI